MTRAKRTKRGAGSILLSRRRGLNNDGSSVVAPRSASITTTTSPLSSKAGRTLIRKHHTLQKRLSQAVAENDLETAGSIRAEIEAYGGLEKYQQASVCGQDIQRGGDSSRVLVDWIRQVGRSTPKKKISEQQKKLRMLEVGALRPDNACSRSSVFDVTRIDLNSRHPSIQTQDFMHRPVPADDAQRFDIISLSLVLNYVSLPAARGEMLRRTTEFLRYHPQSPDQDSLMTDFFPSLFLVLPAPCVMNSRYLDERRLAGIMASLGYCLVKSKLSAKLIYQLWKLGSVAATTASLTGFNKEEVNPGRTRNNFAIVLR